MGVEEQSDAVIAALPDGLLIDGRWVASAAGGRFEVIDPATERPLAVIADARPADAGAALVAAQGAQALWAAAPPRRRADVLRRAYERMIADEERLALIMTREMGKPLADSRAEVRYAADFFRWFAEEAVRIRGTHTMAPDGRGQILTIRQPVGPALLITPWNFPLAMGARKIGPAIAAGCSMVFKPAGQTPLSTLAIAEILQDSGLPAGVFNVLTTSRSHDVVEPLLRSGVIRKLSFTGSTEVGRALLAQAADTVVRTSMELGGNAPFIVFDDADLDVAVDAAVNAKMRNMGEACTAANRFYAQAGVADEFTERFAARVSAMKVGRGVVDGVTVGPLINEAARAKVQRLVKDAIDRGASLVTGGETPEGAGFFYPPTVLAEVPSDAAILAEEVFGPVAPIVTFDTEAQVVTAANATHWGLVAFVITSDLDRVQRLVAALEAGMVGVNTGIVSDAAAPFGGVKQSGLGREGGHLGIDEFLIHKYVAVASPRAGS